MSIQEPKIYLPVIIENEDLYFDLLVYCENNRITMNDALHKAIELLVNSNTKG